mmetsp:Transcript_6595/g.19021  ORF Transcript_6595/g.19021 Transcript_6595/m.19021 type:complete len:217 (+) Transcript_6595:1369-2019(+)
MLSPVTTTRTPAAVSPSSTSPLAYWKYEQSAEGTACQMRRFASPSGRTNSPGASPVQHLPLHAGSSLRFSYTPDPSPPLSQWEAGTVSWRPAAANGHCCAAASNGHSGSLPHAGVTSGSSLLLSQKHSSVTNLLHAAGLLPGLKRMTSSAPMVTPNKAVTKLCVTSFTSRSGLRWGLLCVADDLLKVAGLLGDAANSVSPLRTGSRAGEFSSCCES